MFYASTTTTKIVPDDYDQRKILIIYYFKPSWSNHIGHHLFIRIIVRLVDGIFQNTHPLKRFRQPLPQQKAFLIHIWGFKKHQHHLPTVMGPHEYTV